MTAKLPETMDGPRLGAGILPNWPAIDGARLVKGNTQDFQRVPRGIQADENGSIVVVWAGADDAFTSASVTIGSANSRLDFTAREGGTAGNSLRVAIVRGASASPQIAYDFTTATGVSTFTITLGTGFTITAEAFLLLFNDTSGGDPDLQAAQRAFTVALTNGSDGSGDLNPVAAAALTGGTQTPPEHTLTVVGGAVYSWCIRRLVSTTPNSMNVNGFY